MMYFLTFMIILNWFYSNTTAESNYCQYKTYHVDIQKKLPEEFNNEFSLVNYVAKKFNDYIGIPSTSNEQIRRLCACAFTHREKLTEINTQEPARRFEEILTHTTAEKPGIVDFNIRYWYLYSTKVPYRYETCKSDRDSCVILKGYGAKSFNPPVYNIYVGDKTPTGVDFQGVFNDVDIRVEVSVPTI